MRYVTLLLLLMMACSPSPAEKPTPPVATTDRGSISARIDGIRVGN